MFLIDMFNKKMTMPTPETALPGRPSPIPTATTHFVNGRPLKGPHPGGMKTVYFGMGCFWGAERLFWQTAGVWVTAAGYQGGFTPNPTYQETVTGLTGHAEVVKVVYDPDAVPFEDLLKIFFENHDPTQGMRQGNDVGTTYRSVIFVEGVEDFERAQGMRDGFQQALIAAGRKNTVTTEVVLAPEFYYAEDYHQQYLAKNPGGYCGLKGTGVTCPAV